MANGAGCAAVGLVVSLGIIAWGALKQEQIGTPQPPKTIERPRTAEIRAEIAEFCSIVNDASPRYFSLSKQYDKCG
jgi:hypothetical protein